MKIKNAIRHLINSYRAVFKKTHIGYMALVAVLVAGGISSACSYTADIEVAQISSNNFSDSKENFMKYDVSYKVEVYPKTSLFVSHQALSGFIKSGPGVVIYIVLTTQPSPHSPTPPATGGSSEQRLWLAASQEGLEIGKNEITITEWEGMILLISGQEHYYFSATGDGVLKIKKQGTSFHGTASFHFTDPSYDHMNLNSEENIDWTF